MKKMMKIFLMIFLFLILIIVVNKKIEEFKFRSEQNKLAELLNISIDDYNREGFPDNYFSPQLERGMSREQVQKTIIGYKTVYHPIDVCYYELYCYFHNDTEKANCFRVLYNDAESEYDGFQSAGNSISFSSNGMILGQCE